MQQKKTKLFLIVNYKNVTAMLCQAGMLITVHTMSHTVHVTQANEILNNLVNGELPTLESITSIDGLIKGLGINDVKNFVNKFNVTIEQEHTSGKWLLS